VVAHLSFQLLALDGAFTARVLPGKTFQLARAALVRKLVRVAVGATTYRLVLGRQFLTVVLVALLGLLANERCLQPLQQLVQHLRHHQLLARLGLESPRAVQTQLAVLRASMAIVVLLPLDRCSDVARSIDAVCDCKHLCSFIVMYSFLMPQKQAKATMLPCDSFYSGGLVALLLHVLWD